MERVRITEGHTSSWLPCRRMFVGDTEIHNVTSIDVSVRPGEIASFNVGLVGELDVEIMGDVQFTCDTKTIQSAALVLMKQIENDKDFRDAFVASVYSGIKDCGDKLCGYAMAEKIVSRVIGES